MNQEQQQQQEAIDLKCQTNQRVDLSAILTANNFDQQSSSNLKEEINKDQENIKDQNKYEQNTQESFQKQKEEQNFIIYNKLETNQQIEQIHSLKEKKYVIFQDKQLFIQAKIQNHQIKDDLKGLLHYATYNITGLYNYNEFYVQRRYSDFLSLRQSLINLFPGCFIPMIPSKQAIGNLEKKFLEKRIYGLQIFLDNIIKLDYICQSQFLKKFFDQQCLNFEQYVKQCITPTYQDLIQNFQICFSELQGKEISPTVIMSIQSFQKNLKSIKEEVQIIKEQAIKADQSYGKYIIAINDLNFKYLTSYEIKTYQYYQVQEQVQVRQQSVFGPQKNKLSSAIQSQYSQIRAQSMNLQLLKEENQRVIDNERLILGNLNQNSQVIEEKQILNQTFQENGNFLKELLFYIEDEQNEIQMGLEAIEQKEKYEKLLTQTQSKILKHEKDIQSLNSNKLSFEKIFKQGSKQDKIKHHLSRIDSYKVAQLNLQTILDIIMVIIHYVEIENYKAFIFKFKY